MKCSVTSKSRKIYGHLNDIFIHFRKRVNPLYDAMTQSMPSIYNKNKSPADEALRQQVRFLKCALIVLVVLTCAAIAVSIFAVVSHNQTKGTFKDFVTNSSY